MKAVPLFAFTATLFIQGMALAQSDTPPVEGTANLPTREPQFRVSLPGGTYAVAVKTITSVSSHEYIVDGAARVYEVNIDTTGKALVRFYYIEAITPRTPGAIGQSSVDRIQDLAKEALGRVDQDEIWRRVSKTYPGSTHAHTIEYRVQSREELAKIYKDADEAFRMQMGKALKL